MYFLSITYVLLVYDLSTTHVFLPVTGKSGPDKFGPSEFGLKYKC